MEAEDVRSPRDRLTALNANPLYRTLGIHVEEAQRGIARASLKPPANVCWPFPGQPHGGVLCALLDTTMAWAVFSELKSDQNCATVHLGMEYLQPARGRRFSCMAWNVHRTGRLSFVRGEVRDHGGDLLLIGQATFRIIRMTPGADPTATGDFA